MLASNNTTHYKTPIDGSTAQTNPITMDTRKDVTPTAGNIAELIAALGVKLQERGKCDQDHLFMPLI